MGGITTHTITVAIGEDIASKIMAFCQQGPRGRAICVLSANGAVSTVTLGRPSTLSATVTYEGRFEIMSMSGSYLPTNDGLSGNRTGGVTVLLSSPDGHPFGGGVSGVLIAASQVQVLLGTFMFGGSNTEKKGNFRRRRSYGVRSSGSS